MRRGWMGRRATLGLACMLLVVSGCHTIRFDISNQPAARVVHERKSFFFWGLVPGNKEVDVRRRCPGGVSAIREQTSFTDGLMTVLFLGIWELRSSWYYCLPEEGKG
jgi:hypothetical protein